MDLMEAGWAARPTLSSAAILHKPLSSSILSSGSLALIAQITTQHNTTQHSTTQHHRTEKNTKHDERGPLDGILPVESAADPPLLASSPRSPPTPRFAHAASLLRTAHSLASTPLGMHARINIAPLKRPELGESLDFHSCMRALSHHTCHVAPQCQQPAPPRSQDRCSPDSVRLPDR
jgi:hypothetical protein